jgi:hypothetical protein
VDAADHYRRLVALGRDGFLAAAPRAVLVRYRTDDTPFDASTGGDTMTLEDETIDETMPHGRPGMNEVDLDVFPLVKKPGASFPDRITIGRTSNNDIVIADHSISRLHAYVRGGDQSWVVADAGSKNGSWLRGEALEPRREKSLPSRAVLRLGDVDVTFYLAADLYTVLGGLP